MNSRHVPTIDSRYWVGITLASVFGTNLGDFYAHESGLGLLGGIPILVAVFAAIYIVERFDRRNHDAYYWLCIIVMRTGATNIADYMAGRRGLNIDRLSLSVGLGLALAFLAWWSGRRAHRSRVDPAARIGLPETDGRYWLAMLTAGVFGTVLGDYFQQRVGQGYAVAVLTGLLILALAVYARALRRPLYAYWFTIGVARTAGTAIGDWLAENKMMGLGLTRSTLLTGAAFIAVLVFWRTRRRVSDAGAA